MTVIKFNDVLAKDEVISEWKTIRTTKPIEDYVLWTRLQLLDNEGLLSKGYLTKVKSGKTSKVAASKHVAKMLSQLNVKVFAKPFPGKLNHYVVVLAIKVA